ncbi:MAG: Wzz/FepE/Etk N-terminal domain-containing protein, partial [Steroidobacteraceae bacterium]
MESSPADTAASAERGSWVWVPEMRASGQLLGELLGEFRRRRRQLLATFVGAAAVAFAVSFLFPTQYRSTATLAPIGGQQSGTLGTIAGQLSGLAAFTGVSILSPAEYQSVVALATLQSRAFLVNFARRHELLVMLFPGRYDDSTDQWRARHWLFGGGEPTDDEIIEEMTDTVDIAPDSLTGLITVSVLSRTPQLAQQWAQALISDINEHLRLTDVAESERSIEYLKRQIDSTTVAELRQVLFRLIEEHTKKAMLAHVSTEFALRTVDPPS